MQNRTSLTITVKLDLLFNIRVRLKIDDFRTHFALLLRNCVVHPRQTQIQKTRIYTLHSRGSYFPDIVQNVLASSEGLENGWLQ